MLGAGQKDINIASEFAEKAYAEVMNSESEVRSFTKKVSDYQSTILQAEREIQQADSKIHKMKGQLKNLSFRREVVADIQAKTRRVVHQLGSLSVVGNAAEVQTRFLIQLEPMMKVMEEMTSALGRITDGKMQHTVGMKRLMWEMKTNQKKLQEKAMTEDNTYNMYY